MWFDQWRGASSVLIRLLLFSLLSYAALVYFHWKFPVHSESFGRWILAENHSPLKQKILNRFDDEKKASSIQLVSFESNVKAWERLKPDWQRALKSREKSRFEEAIHVDLSLRWLSGAQKFSITAKEASLKTADRSGVREEIEIRKSPPSFYGLLAWFAFLGAILCLPRFWPGTKKKNSTLFSANLLLAPWIGLVFGMAGELGVLPILWIQELPVLFFGLFSEPFLLLIPGVLFLAFYLRVPFNLAFFLGCFLLLIEGLILFADKLLRFNENNLQIFSFWSLGLLSVFYLVVSLGAHLSIHQKSPMRVSFRGYPINPRDLFYLGFFSLGLMLFQSWSSQAEIQAFWALLGQNFFSDSLANNWSQGLFKGLFIPLGSIGPNLVEAGFDSFRSFRVSAFSDGFLLGRLLSPFHMYFWAFLFVRQNRVGLVSKDDLSWLSYGMILGGLVCLLCWAYYLELRGGLPPALLALLMAFVVLVFDRGFTSLFLKKRVR
jgi:hypothetical protein